MIKKLCRANDNLLSFLCGIFSNIPISLLFAVAEWGNNWFKHAYLLVWIFAFLVSVALTASAFSFTLCKIAIQKVIDEVQGKQAKEQALIVELSKKDNMKKLRGSLIGFIICAVLLFLSLIAVWILGNAEWIFCNVV